MLDPQNAKLLESKVFERLNIEQSDGVVDKSILKEIRRIAVHATIVTLQEYEKFNNMPPEK